MADKGEPILYIEFEAPSKQAKCINNKAVVKTHFLGIICHKVRLPQLGISNMKSTWIENDLWKKVLLSFPKSEDGILKSEDVINFPFFS